ncbi:RidA family protein [Chelativorans sp. J32]|uniref:RidA family protein n=1 Tax=Chelativorans sp. J32 TaxID=935840 RepID=UPI00048069C5|nr:RidA family protein [Chelativorans sp. J32]
MVERIKKGKTLHGIVVHGGVAYTAGIGADDIGQDMEGQTRQICAKIDALLASAGSDKSKLLRAEIFITDMARKPDMDRAWLAWLDESDLPARATIGVADLGDPQRLIEVIVTAAC